MLDRAKIFVEGGAGGNGSISFRREAHVPRGGPDGGDGGHGGNVELVCDPSRRDLGPLAGSKHFRAARGSHGEGSNRHGARGENREILVPPGTQGVTVDGSSIDLVDAGQRAIVAHGGRGGHGNRRFANSTRQAPRFAEKGTSGEAGWIELQLKLLADAGLIGLPNAGKSSLLGRLTRAAPKVADYPFTTLSPALGVLDGEDRQAVLADIPGLIEGAAEGAGLGHEFLAHVERARCWSTSSTWRRSKGTPRRITPAPGGARLLRSRGRPPAGARRPLQARPRPPDDVGMAIMEWRRRLGESVIDILPVSSATGEGLVELRSAILTNLPGALDEPSGRGEPAAGFEVEHRVYRPAGEGGYRVEREDDGAYRVLGRGVELLFERHDLKNEEALAYLESRLNEIGVVSALRAAGFEAGDDLRVGEHEFELHPSARVRPEPDRPGAGAEVGPDHRPGCWG